MACGLKVKGHGGLPKQSSADPTWTVRLTVVLFVEAHIFYSLERPAQRPQTEKTPVCRDMQAGVQIVRSGGFEPPTFGTGIQRSIQLSYERAEEHLLLRA